MSLNEKLDLIDFYIGCKYLCTETKWFMINSLINL